MRDRPTDVEILAQLPAARAQGRAAAGAEPRAEAAFHDRESGLVVVRLKNGCTFGFPPALADGLEHATPDQLAQVELDPGGEGLHWEEIDADVSVPGLMFRLLNVRGWAAKYAGAVRSTSKAAASRENGKKGGRPRRAGREAA